MKNTLSLLLLLILPVLTFGQTEISVGSPYGVIDAEEKYYFHQGSDILSVKIDRKSITLQKFDSQDLSFKNIRIYDDMPDGFDVEKVSEYNNRYFVFYSLWDKKNEKEQLFYREINFEQGAFEGEPQLIVAVDGKITGAPMGRIGFWSFGVTDKFDFQFSYDDSKMLVQYRLRPKVKNDSKSYDIIGMSVFDENLSLLWNKEVEMPYTEKKMNNLDYSIDSEGNTYILTMVYEDDTTDKKKRNGEANYHIELFRINANSSHIAITPIELEDKFISRLWLYEGPYSYMVCAGFYNDGKDLDDAKGILLFKADLEGEIFDIATYEIPLEVLNQYESNRSQRKNTRKSQKGKAEFEDLVLREIIVEDDGGLLLIGEQYYMLTHTTYQNNMPRTTYSYHYNDMLVTKINGYGEFEWMRKLPKRQTGGSGQGGMSYEFMKGDNSYYFLFLDNVKNMDLPLNEVPAGHVDGRGGYLTAYKVGAVDGEVSKYSILDTRNVSGIKVYQFLTSRILPLSNNEFVFEVYKKRKEDILVKVNFPK